MPINPDEFMQLNNPLPEAPEILLGTAMWGWTVPPETCFRVLDSFYESGFRAVDAATNYPINKVPEDFRKSEQILLQWIRAHGVSDLRITMKIGSLNNLRSPECNLTKSFLLFCLEEYGGLFGRNLHTMMVHWDNREAPEAIANTLEALAEMAKKGVRTGLSGIRFPAIYADVNAQFGLDFSIQMKHNLLQSDYERYAPFHGKRRFYAYGLNAGGVKLKAGDYQESSSLKARGGDPAQSAALVERLAAFLEDAPPLLNFNHAGMLYAWYHPDIAGLLIGVSSLEQLRESLDFYQTLRQGNYRGLYEQLLTLQQDHGPAF